MRVRVPPNKALKLTSAGRGLKRPRLAQGPTALFIAYDRSSELSLVTDTPPRHCRSTRGPYGR